MEPETPVTDGVNLVRMNKAELVEWAADRGIEVDVKLLKDDMVGFIYDKLQSQAAGSTTDTAGLVAENGGPEKVAASAPGDEPVTVTTAGDAGKQPETHDEKLARIMAATACHGCSTVDRWEDMAKGGPIRQIKCRICGCTKTINL